MTTEIHDERALQRRVVAAMERIEEPDRERLAAIERRLRARVRRSRSHPGWWLIIGLGLAAGAAAAYWGMGPAREAPVDDREPGAPGTTRESGPHTQGRDDADKEQVQGAGPEQGEDDGPVIYIGE